MEFDFFNVSLRYQNLILTNHKNHSQSAYGPLNQSGLQQIDESR